MTQTVCDWCGQVIDPAVQFPDSIRATVDITDADGTVSPLTLAFPFRWILTDNAGYGAPNHGTDVCCPCVMRCFEAALERQGVMALATGTSPLLPPSEGQARRVMEI